MTTLNLYFRLVGASLRSQMQYKLSFIAQLIGTFLMTIIDFVGVFILFQRFDSIGGWGFVEVAFLYGLSSLSFSLAEFVVTGFQAVPHLIKRGEFDRIMIRPLSAFFQILAFKLNLRRLASLAQGLVILILAVSQLDFAFTPAKGLLFVLTIVGGAFFFTAIFIAGATVSFWTVGSIEAANIFTYGGSQMLRYPFHIYHEWLQRLFTFIIPMIFINYLPALFILDKPNPLGFPTSIAFFAPIVDVAVLGLAILFWQQGVQQYQGTGS